MNELRILFAKSGDGLTYRLATSWGGDSGQPRPFAPFLSDADYKDLRWYQEEYLDLPDGGSRVRAQRIEALIPAWGKRLFDAVFGEGDHRDLVRALLDGEAPRLLTVGTGDPDLLRLPWELMADGTRPLTARGVTIRRQLESPRPPDKYEAGKLPLRILLAVSRPDDAGFIDPRHTTRAMLDALAPLGDGVVVDFCRPATVERLDRMLREAEREGRPYHIVHFDGHGTFLEKAQIGALCFEKDEGADGAVATDLAHADRVGQLLTAHKIPLVLLEACQSAEIGDVAFRGVAPALLEAGVGSVLAMSHAVHVGATRILLARFYEELAGGASIGAALEAGRSALVAKPHRWGLAGRLGPTVALADWFVPQLYQRGADLVLAPRNAKLGKRAKAKAGERRAPASGEEPGAFPPKPMYGFFGRARELHRIERRFLKHRAVLLHAMGGMGKTSLAREGAIWWTKPTGLFPDGAVFVSFERPGGAQRAVQLLGGYFDGAEFAQRSEEEQRSRAKELFQTKRVLVVWDNFESVLPTFQKGEAVPLYGDEERAAIYKLYESWMAEDKALGRLLVTCRPGETTGLSGACKVELAGLARADALLLLYEVMQRAEVRAAYDRDELSALLETVDMHPLSIELVGPHLRDMKPRAIMTDFNKLLDKFAGEAKEDRNRSLKASIEFSLKRLSAGAREAVRWLGLFQGGVFEDNLLDVSQMDPEVWDTARGELEATALVGVEREFNVNGKPYLRFHPTLAVAAGDGVDEAGVRERYVKVYLAVALSILKAFSGSNPRVGMEVMLREEANLRKALGWALEQGAYDWASDMGETLALYLQVAGRLREWDGLVTWLAAEVHNGGFSKAAANQEQGEAWAFLTRGEPRKGLEKLEALVTQLRATTEFDAAFTLANACRMLGRAYHAVGWAQKAIPVLKDAVVQWEALVARAQEAGKTGSAERGNLSATLGSLANALRDAGALDEALAAAEQGIAIDRALGDQRAIAAGMGQIAQLFAQQGRHADADARLDEALQAAQRAGDRELEGTLLQHQGSLADDRGQLERAATLYKRALQLFQEMHHDGSIMLTSNLLGVVEHKAGRLAEARAWYQRSRAMASSRGDQRSVGAAAQNLSVVCTLEGEAAREQGNEPKARERFEEAARFVGESLDVWRENHDEPHEADSHTQLARIQLLLGALDHAEEHAHLARAIHEHLGLIDVWKDYATLARIAHARGNPADAATWEQKRDTLLAELRRRAAPSV